MRLRNDRSDKSSCIALGVHETLAFSCIGFLGLYFVFVLFVSIERLSARFQGDFTALAQGWTQLWA